MPVVSPFRNSVKPVWCPGCGDFAVLDALTAALGELGRPPEDVAVVSGIGCSSRLPGYLACHAFNTLHGRALPIASGLKLARPGLTVVATTGDGDGFAIGRRHVAPAVARGLELTWIVMDNGVYGLTKGQASPTTPAGARTSITPQGKPEAALNPLALMLECGAPWVAQGSSADPRGLSALVLEALRYPGFAFLNVLSPCPVFRGGMGLYKELRASLRPVAHDVADHSAALAAARAATQPLSGVMYRRQNGGSAGRVAG
jgi:2-oxoglutarate ferredoxin oxidoreductase subunit beta